MTPEPSSSYYPNIGALIVGIVCVCVFLFFLGGEGGGGSILSLYCTKEPHKEDW